MERVEEKMKQLRKERDQKIRMEADTKRMMAAVERAARSQLAKDINGGIVSSEGVSLVSPSFKDRSMSHLVGVSKKMKKTRSKGPAPSPPPPPPHVDARFGESDGHTYILGPSCEEMLGVGVNCEIRSKSLDAWCPARIEGVVLRRHRKSASQTRRYRVRLFLPRGWIEENDSATGRVKYVHGNSGEISWTRPAFASSVNIRRILSEGVDKFVLSQRVLENVESVSIRLMPAPPPPLPSSSSSSACKSEVPGTKINFSINPMIGGWETVAVTSDQISSEPETSDTIARKLENEEARPSKSDFVNAPNIGTTDAYDVMNPWGGDYRGVDLRKSETRRGTLQDDLLDREDDDDRVVVAFRKKGKRDAGGTSLTNLKANRKKKRRKKRNFRTRSSED